MKFRRWLPTILRSGSGVSTPALQTTMLGLSPIAYWPLTETSGTVMTDLSGNGFHGTYSNVTLNNTVCPDGVNKAPLWVPASSSYGNLYSVGFDALASKTEFSVVWFEKVRAASVWNDSTLRHSVVFLADVTNVIRARKFNSLNLQRFDYTAGATSDTVDYSGGATTWLLCAMTVSVAANQMKAYINNAQNGGTQGTLGTWVGVFSPIGTCLGASGTVGPGNVWDGWLSHVAYYNSILTLANIQAIYATATL